MDWISQGSSKSSKCYLHHIPIFQMDARSETQAVRTEKMDVDVTRPPVACKLKMVVFHVLQAVAHLCLAGPELGRPKRLAVPFNIYFHLHGLELGIHHQLRTERAGAKF